MSTGKKYMSIDEYRELFTDLGYEFALNMLDDSIWNHGVRFSDIDRSRLRCLICDHHNTSGHKLQIRQVDRCISLVANENAYHPVKKYLEGLTWDGDDHISALSECFQDGYGTFGECFYQWLVGAVAKVYEPYPNRPLIIVTKNEEFNLWDTYDLPELLCSPLPDLFYRGDILPDTKQHKFQLTNTLIWYAHAGDISRDTRRLYGFLTRSRVNMRKPCSRKTIDKPAITSFIGIIDSTELGDVPDPECNPGLLAVEINDIDYRYMKANVSQLWAQAKHLYDTSDGWSLRK